ncbi:sensor histidine kinase [Endothiovibrio diazotrophicus]
MMHLPPLHCASTLGELPAFDETVGSETPGEEVARRLRSREELPGVMVTHEGHLAGVISRRGFLETMSQRYGLEIYLQRPVRMLLEALPTPPLRLPAELSVHHAAARALERPEAELYEPVAVDSGGRPRLVDVHTLLRAQSRILELAHAETARALDELRDTQEDLLEARKMAALGQLVAGIAHEINTPVGVSLTAATHWREEAARLRSAFEGGGLKRSELKRFLSHGDESAGLVITNLQRAAELIRGFKQVAVDQSVETRRPFKLRSYLKTVLHSLRPRLKQTPHVVEVECPKRLTLDSYPGALWQVITNLTINALTHAFEEGAKGLVRIDVHERDERVLIDFRDNGRGVPKAHQERLFEPFFTTRRGRGGTGLGLHITYNLVTRRLGGEIHCESPTPAGPGTRFLIDIPAVAPDADRSTT